MVLEKDKIYYIRNTDTPWTTANHHHFSSQSGYTLGQEPRGLTAVTIPTASFFTSMMQKVNKVLTVLPVMTTDFWARNMLKFSSKLKKRPWIFLSCRYVNRKRTQTILLSSNQKKIPFPPSKNSSNLKIISVSINPLNFEDRNLTSIEKYEILTYSVVEIPTSPHIPHPQKTLSKML